MHFGHLLQHLACADEQLLTEQQMQEQSMRYPGDEQGMEPGHTLPMLMRMSQTTNAVIQCFLTSLNANKDQLSSLAIAHP